MLNGVLHCSYGNAAEGVIAGWILLDKSHLKGNVFSSDVQKEVFSKTIFPLKFYNNNLNLDIIAMCQDQLTINTPFIEANAKFNFKVTGNLTQPNVSGFINLLGGEFKFPYKPLYINSGKIIFSGPSMEPTIDLMAQQTIKKMDVRMNVSGLLSSPDINFESNDNLTKEEIITLLVSGSRDGGIHATVPQVLMKNLKDLLIGSADTSPRLSYLKNVLRPLENITIVPKFSDQSARGGIKGAIEMDISDKLRAKIQKNFSLSEDVLIEVDYDINDNVGIKGIKDERGDLGAEVEMRWKF